MNQRHAAFAIANILLLLIVTACGAPSTKAPPSTIPPAPSGLPTKEAPSQGSGNSGSGDAHQLYAGLTGDNAVPFLALHPQGERLGVYESIYASSITVIWGSASGDTAVIYADGNALPQYVVDGDVIFEYSNYTPSSVDVTAILPDGSRETIRTKLSSALLQMHAAIPTQSLHTVDLPVGGRLVEKAQVFTYLDEAFFALEIASCALAAAVFTPTIAGTVAIIAACASPLLHEYILEQRAQGLDVGALEAFEGNLGQFGCASALAVGDRKKAILDCVKAIVGAFADVERDAANRVSNIPPAPMYPSPSPRYP